VSGSLVNNGSGNIRLTNSLVVNNTGAFSGPFLLSGGHNLTNEDNGLTNPALGDILVSGTVPLDPLQYNGGPTPTHALPVGSKAINAGDDAVAPATDQRGINRPQGAKSDIGAFE